MNLLALETSTRAGSVALQLGGERVSEALCAERAHATDLLPAVVRLLAPFGAGPGDLEGVVVGTGPGSYTGLRVGIATALGLARGLDVPVLGVPSVEALAFEHLRAGESTAVLLDARSRAFYVARYARRGDELEELLAPVALRREELERAIAGEEAILGDERVGETAGLCEETLARLRPGRVPRAPALLSLGAPRLLRGEAEGCTPEPLYLRAFGE